MTITLSEIQRLHDECVREAEKFPEATGLMDQTLYAFDSQFRSDEMSTQLCVAFAESLGASGPWTELAEAVKAWRGLSRDERLGALREEMEQGEHWIRRAPPDVFWREFDKLALVRAQVKAMEGE